MNPYIFPPILAAVLNATLVFWVYSHAPAGLVRRTFLFWNCWLGLWNLGVAVGYALPDASTSYLWYRWVGAVVVRFIAPLFLHFVIAITDTADQKWNRRLLAIAYALGFLFACVGGMTSFLMRGAVPFYWGYYPLAGNGEWTFGISYTATIAYAFRLLIQALRRTSGHAREQIKYVFLGAAICFAGGFTNFLPLYGHSIYPIGNLMNSIYSLVVAYAIVEYELMDIRMVLQKGTVYGLLSGGLTVVYLSLVAVLQRLFGHYGVQENVAFYTAAFPITVILAPTMKSRIEPLIGHAFFSEHRRGSKPPIRNQNMALMGILATEMAHELAKPLTHIMNAGSRLDSSIKGLQREHLKTIEKEVQRASEILDGFAMLSPERTLHRISIPLIDLVEEAISTLDLNEDKTVQVVRHFDAMPPVSVNPGQIVQVLTNLIQNAWQAMPEGGRLTLSIRSVTAANVKPEVEISISDTGRGIAADVLEKVFEPFFTTKEEQGGRGMGLTISRAMVERHGGTIDIRSPIKAGRGTCVVVRLPRRSTEETYES